ncbi:hypothetical protein BKA61DRAFT_574858 [Leptodontidium sp. MPI-SDFR-AT-0119]|nr:hypothetical protein BKA61DRAFT_574858 [Leptodontidium sp. MPI-SDFR-AT-0119]
MFNLTRPQRAHTARRSSSEDIELALGDFLDLAPPPYVYAPPYRKSAHPPPPPSLPQDSRPIVLPYQLSQLPDRRSSNPYARGRSSWYRRRPWNIRFTHLIVFAVLVAVTLLLAAIVFQIVRIALGHVGDDDAVD